MFRKAAENLRELIRRRELIRFLVTSNLKSSQKNTFLGYLWWLMSPLLLMLVYTAMMFILGRGRALPAYPMFLFAALLPWQSFQGALQESVAAISKNESLIKRVPFPKAVIPISLVISNFVECLIGFVVLIVIGLFFGIYPTWHYVFLPIPLLVMITLTLGLALCFSFFGVWFRDLENILKFVLRLWWYMSPGLYALFTVEAMAKTKPWLVTLFKLNPFATLLPAIHSSVYFPGIASSKPDMQHIAAQGMAFDWIGLGIWFAVSVGIVVVGYVMFVNNEHKFGKVL